MTAYFGSEEVDIVGGSIEEGWAAIQFPDTDEPRDVAILQLTAEDADEDIYNPIETRGPLMGRDFEQYLPLDIRVKNERVTIVARNSIHIYRNDLYEHYEDGRNTIIDEALDALRKVQMVHNQPLRFLFRFRDQLPDSEE